VSRQETGSACTGKQEICLVLELPWYAFPWPFLAGEFSGQNAVKQAPERLLHGIVIFTYLP